MIGNTTEVIKGCPMGIHDKIPSLDGATIKVCKTMMQLPQTLGTAKVVVLFSTAIGS